MTEFCELTKGEYADFYAEHPYRTFLNSVEAMEHLRMRGRDIVYFGVKRDGKLCAAAAVSSFPIAKKMLRCFYAQRGYLMDFSDREVLHCMTQNISAYAKKHRGLFLVIDPYVLYKERDIDGNIVEGGFDNSSVIAALEAEGYVHKPFTAGVGTDSQANYMFTLDLSGKDEDTVWKEMAQQTRWSVNRTLKQGIEVRELGPEELDVFLDMEERTAQRRGFSMFPRSYYRQMVEAYGRHARVLLAYLDTEKFAASLKQEIEETDLQMAETEQKLAEMPGSKKFQKKKKVLEEALEINAKKTQEAERLRKQYGAVIPMASAFFTLYDNEAVYYASAAEEEFRNYYAPYAIQWYMLKECIRRGIPRYNFYAVSGDFSENAVDYGVYEFKKGFGGTVEQTVGDFTLVLNRPVYALYEKLK